MAVFVEKCTAGLTLCIDFCLLLVFPRKPRSEHGEIIPAGAKYQNKVHPYNALALVWTHLHASRVLWMLCRLVESHNPGGGTLGLSGWGCAEAKASRVPAACWDPGSLSLYQR